MLATKEKPRQEDGAVPGVSKAPRKLNTKYKNNDTTVLAFREEYLKTGKVKDIFDRLNYKPSYKLSTKAILQKISNDEDDRQEDVKEPSARCIFCNSTNIFSNTKLIYCLNCQKWEDDKRLPREEIYA